MLASNLFICSAIWMNRRFRFNERKNEDNDKGRFLKSMASR